MSLERWLNRLQPRTAKISKWIFDDFIKWLRINGAEFKDMGPDELVLWQRKHLGDYTLLDTVEDYVRQKKGTFEYKKRCYGAIRSIFLHNRCELPRDASFQIMGTKPSVRGEFKVDEFRRVLASCNTLYRAVFLTMFQAGMGIGELIYFDQNYYEYLLDQIRDRVAPIRIDLPGRKKMKFKKPYYTFLGKDSVAALMVWLEERPTEAGKNIFCTQFLKPLGYNAAQMYWLKKLSDLGFIERKHDNNSGNRYGKNLHELRDLFKTRWRPSNVDMELADYFMGHDIDELGYDKSPRDYADYFREGYEKAEPWLNVLSYDPEKVPRSEMDRKLREMKETQDAELASIQRRLELLEKRRR